MSHLRSLTTAFLFALWALPSFASDRTLSITAPAETSPGAGLSVTITASTAETTGEQVWFLHSEFSTDQGESWVGLIYDQDLGTTVTRTTQIKVGRDLAAVWVRVRASFRGGPGGDVDFKGEPIKWETSWANWSTPPARIVKIPVK